MSHLSCDPLIKQITVDIRLSLEGVYLLTNGPLKWDIFQPIITNGLSTAVSLCKLSECLGRALAGPNHGCVGQLRQQGEPSLTTGQSEKTAHA